MAPFPFLLVVISVFSHASWNFLAKRAYDKDIFFGLSKVAETTLFVVPFAWVLSNEGVAWQNWYFIAGAALLVFLYYLFLAQAYKRLDLSVAYPVARASGLFLPFLAYLVIGETVDWVGGLSLVLVTVGVLIIQMESFDRASLRRLTSQFARPGIIFALLTAFMYASYTLWDKISVSHLHPFIYLFSYTAVITLFYLIKLRKAPKEHVLHEWQQHKWAIIAVGFLDTFTYVLVLTALQTSKANYVSALRQLSLAVGVFLGWRYLQEPMTVPKLTAVFLLMTGAWLVLLAH